MLQCNPQQETSTCWGRGVDGTGYKDGVHVEGKGGLLEGMAGMQCFLDDGIAGGDGWDVVGCVGEAVVGND